MKKRKIRILEHCSPDGAAEHTSD